MIAIDSQTKVEKVKKQTKRGEAKRENYCRSRDESRKDMTA